MLCYVNCIVLYFIFVILYNMLYYIICDCSCREQRKKVGLYMNEDKCKVMISNDWKDNTEIKIGSKDIDFIGEFCYIWVVMC